MWKPKVPRSWAPATRETFVAALVLFVFVNLTLLPFVWGHSTLEDSEFTPSLYSTGSRYPAVSGPSVNRVLDPGAPAWQTEPEFLLERRLLTQEHVPPLWNPYSAFGTPLAANMQSQPYSPFAWLRFLWPSPRGYDVFVMLRLFVAGLGALLFLRQFVGALPALAGATSFMYAGYYWLYVTMPEISTEVLLPGVLFALERLLRRPGPGGAVLLALVIALCIFGGMPESALLLLGLSYIYALVRIVTDESVRARLRNVALFGGSATILGLGLSAVLMLPFLQYVGVSSNTHSAPGEALGLAADGFSSTSIAQYLAPLLYGGPYNAIFSGFSGYSGIRGFFGVSVAFFALVGVFAQVEDALRRRPQRAPIFFFAAVLVLGLAKRFGVGAVNWIGVLPGLRLINFPKYEENLMALSVAVLAAFGVAALAERRASAPVVWFAAVVPLSILAVASVIDRAAIAGLAAHREFYVNSMRGALVALAIAAALGILARLKISKRAFGIAAVALVFAELNAAYILPLYYVLNGRAPQSATAQSGAPYLTFVGKKLDGGFRFFGEDAILYPDWSSAFGIRDIRSLDALYDERYLPFVRAFLPADGDEDLSDRFVGAARVDFLTPLQRRLLQLSSIAYVATLHPLPAPFRLEYSEPGVTLYRFPDPLPRVSVYERVLLAKDGPSALAAIATSGFDPKRTAIVEGDAPPLRALAGGPGHAVRAGRLELYRSSEVRATVDARAPSLVVFNDTNFPGWQARVDGRDVETFRANYLFRGVLVGAGRHTLEFTYAPFTFVLGLAITCASAAILLALVLVSLRRFISNGRGEG